MAVLQSVFVLVESDRSFTQTRGAIECNVALYKGVGYTA